MYTYKKTSHLKLSYLIKVALLSVIAYIIMFLEFALPIFPSFLKIDLSDIVPLLGSFALGPLAGVLIELIKNLLHFITASSTSGIGELANFVVGSCLCLSAGFFYKYHKTKTGAIISLIIGTFAMMISGMLVNYFITLPLYSLIGWSTEMIVDMSSKVIPLISNKLSLILFAFCPFNLLKGIVVSLILLPLYKHLSPLLHKDYTKK